MKKVVCRDIHGEAQEFDASEVSFRPCVYGVIVKNGKVLLHAYEDGFDFPGGGIELGEKFEETFAREVKEETGLNVKLGELLLALDDRFVHPGTQRPHHSILLYYTGLDPQGTISTEYFDEHEKNVAHEAQWIDIERVSSLKFFNPMTPEQIAALVRKAASIEGSR